MGEFFIGWDVGAWNCDGGDSQDALCVATETKGKLTVRGDWRGNLRQVLDEGSGLGILREFFRVCRIEPPKRAKAAIAIDTPLGWPQPVLQLFLCGNATHVPMKSLSVPEDRAGPVRPGISPAFHSSRYDRQPINKGHSFSKEGGVEDRIRWRVDYDESRHRGYRNRNLPQAPCKKSPSACKAFLDVTGTGNVAGSKRERDLQDALRCALIAWWFRADRSKLAEPSPDIPCDEGWIWLPKDVWTVKPDLD